jgi:transposase
MLQSLPLGPIPEVILSVAKAAIAAGNTYITLRDQIGTIFDDSLFAPLFPVRGQPAAAPWRLAFVTCMQFAEGLSDRDAAEAVRTRIDWKYLLGLELSDPGFDYSILSRFRDRLIEGHAEMSLLQRLLEKCKSLGLLRTRSDMRTDSTHVLASIRNVNRSDLVGETLRATLNVLATVDPNWIAVSVPRPGIRNTQGGLNAAVRFRRRTKSSQQQKRSGEMVLHKALDRVGRLQSSRHIDTNCSGRKVAGVTPAQDSIVCPELSDQAPA